MTIVHPFAYHLCPLPLTGFGIRECVVKDLNDVGIVFRQDSEPE